MKVLIENFILDSLEKYCERKQIDFDEVCEFLRDINAEPELTSLIRISNNVNKILKSRNDTQIQRDHESELFPYQEHIQKLLVSPNDLIEACGPQLGKKQRKIGNRYIHPLYGASLVSNPLYGMLWNISDIDKLKEKFDSKKYHEEPFLDEAREKFQKQFLKIQYEILKVHATIFREKITIEEYLQNGDRIISKGYKQSFVDACRSIRELGHAENYLILNRLMGSYEGGNFADFILNRERSELDDLVLPIRRLFKKFNANRSILRVGGYHLRAQFRKLKIPCSYYVEKIYDIAATEYSKLGSDYEPLVRVLDHWQDVTKYQDIDLPPEESSDQSTMIMGVKGKCTLRKSERDQVMAAIGAANKLKVLNQHLPIHVSLMTYQEIAESMRVFEVELLQSSKMKNKRAAAMGILMYWLGAGVFKLRKMGVCQSEEFITDNTEVAYIKNQGCWRIKVPTYKRKNKPAKQQEELCRKVDQFLYIPDVLGLYQILTYIGGADNEGLRTPFMRHNEKSYVTWINRILSDLKKTGLYITQSSLANNLHMRLLSQGDPMIAMAITGREYSASGVIRHYSSPKISHINQGYLQVIKDILIKINDEIVSGFNLLPKGLNFSIVESPQSIGAEFCPTVDTVKNLFIELRNQIEDADTYQRYHNYFAIYTVLCIQFCTGYRAVNDVDISLNDRDEFRSTAWISDKDQSDGYHTRNVWMSPLLIEQLRHYECHRRVVMASWEIHFPGVRRPDDLEFSLFIVDRTKSAVVPMRPSTLTGPLEKLGYPLPINSNRRFLRTELSEKGIPVDVLNAFMGHWRLGEEPHGRFSCLSPRYFREKLEEYLSPILVEIDMVPIISQWMGDDV